LEEIVRMAPVAAMEGKEAIERRANTLDQRICRLLIAALIGSHEFFYRRFRTRTGRILHLAAAPYYARRPITQNNQEILRDLFAAFAKPN
jgi:hypothetical protein